VVVLLTFPELVPAETLLVLQLGPLLLRRRRRLLDTPVLWRGKGSVLLDVLVLCEFIISIIIFFSFVVVVVAVVVFFFFFFLLVLLIRGCVPVSGSDSSSRGPSTASFLERGENQKKKKKPGRRMAVTYFLYFSSRGSELLFLQQMSGA
jgi:hypothetical protein